MDDEELERLEIQDQAETVGFLTPREFAKLRGMQPQLVYYYIRTKVIDVELCKCGRRIVSVQQADEALQKKQARRGGDLAGVLDARDAGLDQGQGPALQDMSQVDPVEGPVREVRDVGSDAGEDVDMRVVRHGPDVGRPNEA